MPYRFVSGDQTYILTYASSDWAIEPSDPDPPYHLTDEGNSEIDFKCMRNVSGDRGMSYDLGATVSNEKWLMRFQLDLDTIFADSGGGIYENFGLNKVDSSVPEISGNTYLGLSLQHSTSENYFFQTWGVDQGNHSNQTEIGSNMLATGTWYVEMIRLSTTSFSVRVTDQSDYTGGTVVTDTDSNIANIQDLRYFTDKTGSGSEINNYIQGSCNNIKVYDNVTSL
tara:strand:- start:329 stop:1003 length:675 start_codon:yes stop_codon:yes gene_type:complete